MNTTQREEIYRLFYDKILRYAQKSLKKEDAEDIAQETFLSFFVAFHEKDIETNSSIFILYKICENKIIDKWRKPLERNNIDNIEQRQSIYSND